MTKKIKLFCLPFAGGNKYSYRNYELLAPPFLNIQTLEYPGRGDQKKQPLITDLDFLVDKVYKQTRANIGEGEYAIYGHSMGGLLAYLLARKLIQNRDRPPVHLFVTGTIGPSSLKRLEGKKHLLDKKEFLDEIRSYDGIPKEISHDDSFLNYFEPILRADFTACENYEHHDVGPLDIPLTIVTGTNENMEKEEIELWQKETTKRAEFHQMHGSHFFIFDNSTEIINLISEKLSNLN